MKRTLRRVKKLKKDNVSSVADSAIELFLASLS